MVLELLRADRQTYCEANTLTFVTGCGVRSRKCVAVLLLLYILTSHIASMGRVSSVGIATAYGLDGPGIQSRWGARFSAPIQTGLEAHPASYTMGTGSFPGVKRPGRGVDHPPPSSDEVKERVELCLHTSGPLRGLL